jgi:hypothetical protein
MLRTLFRTVKFQALQARNHWSYLMIITFNIRLHIFALILPTGSDVLDILHHKIFRLSYLIVCDIVDSYHPKIVLHVLDHIRAMEVWNRAEKFTDSEWFQSLTSELISPRIQINCSEEAGIRQLTITQPVSPWHRLMTSKATLSSLNNYLPDLHRLLRHKQGLRNLCHETGGPASK